MASEESAVPGTSAKPMCCRLCLCEHTSGSPISVDDYVLDLAKKLLYFELFTHEDVKETICEICKDTVVVFHEFAEQVQRNQNYLRSLKMPIKQEQPDEDAEWAAEALCEIGANNNSNEDIEMLMDVEGGHVKAEELEEEEEDEDDSEPSSDSEPVRKKRKYTPRKAGSAGKKIKTEKKHTPPKDSTSPDEREILKHCNLSCDLCGESQPNFLSLLNHFKHIHNERGYYKCCDKKFFKRCWMIEHITLHLNPDAFHCALCNKSYSSSAVLKEHTKQVHAAKEDLCITCETCHKQFVSPSHLNAHIQVAHGTVPCPKCPKILASQGSLKKHLVALHGDGEQFVCDVCARVFRSKKCLDNHVKLHLGTRIEDKVQCSMCASWFTDQNCLTKHIKRVHEVSEVPLSCEICGWEAKNQPSLYGHMHRVHAELKYECEFCMKKFKRQHHMKEHVAIHHTGVALYDCQYCEEKFNSKNKLYSHRKSMHPVEYEEDARKRFLKEDKVLPDPSASVVFA
ncbi:transcription factor grauzone [Culex quinquefasciatus]|nr:transcription factor grauzone [Culex quinquefasciatus]